MTSLLEVTDEGAATTRAGTAHAVQIIPAPKSLTATGESFRLTRDTRVVLADTKSEDDRFAAEDFVADLHEENLSDVYIVEAGDLARGPIAKIKVPFRLRSGVHGTWVSGR